MCQPADLHTNAQRLIDLVRQTPGRQTNDLARTMDLHPSTVLYHVRRLVAMDLVVRERVGGRVHHYPSGRGWCTLARGVHATLTEAGRTALRIALDRGAVSRSAVRKAGASRPSTRWAFECLQRVGGLERLSWGVYVLPEGRRPCIEAALAGEGHHGCPRAGGQPRRAINSPSPSGRMQT